MEFNKELQEEFKTVVQPVIDFLNKYYNPHTTAIIGNDRIKIVTDEISVPLVDKYGMYL